MSDHPSQIQALIPIIRKYGFEYFGIYYGTYRGFIVDNKDPEYLGRLKLTVPQVSGKNIMQTWAWPKGQIAGEDFGDFKMPPKDSMVWVSFENGDPSYPLWEGGAWAKGQTPTEARKSPPENRVTKTKNWVLEMDDTQGNEKFKITDRRSGNYFLFDSSSGNLNMNITGNEAINTQGNTSHSISGNQTETVSGNKAQAISGSSSEAVTGNKSISCVGFSLAASGYSTMSFGSSVVTLSPSEIGFNVGGHTLVINGAGVYIDGREFLAHTHSGVDPGGGSSGGVN